MTRSTEITAQTFFLFITAALCTVTTVVCLFIRFGGTAALIGTLAVLLVTALAVLAFCMRFIDADDEH